MSLFNVRYLTMIKPHLFHKFISHGNLKLLSPESVLVFAFKRTFSSKDDEPIDDASQISEKCTPANNKAQSKEALRKLNKLLLQMTNDEFSSTKVINLDLAKPRNKRKMGKIQETDETYKSEKIDNKLVSAVKDVAQSIGSNIKQTESELLMKLLSSKTPSTTSQLNEIVKDMQIDRSVKSAEAQSRSQQVKSILEKAKVQKFTSDKPQGKIFIKRKQAQRITERIDLFGSEPLGMFSSNNTEYNDDTENKTWTKLYERELKLAVTHPPANYFQEVMLWTEQGKLWKFPVDNEQDWNEKNIYFADHVFLEEHLEPWCPPKGPVRHFMELVCVGLSKNPYLSVEAKKEHIEWYKNYFEDKKQILLETGAIKLEIEQQHLSDK